MQPDNARKTQSNNGRKTVVCGDDGYKVRTEKTSASSSQGEPDM